MSSSSAVRARSRRVPCVSEMSNDPTRSVSQAPFDPAKAGPQFVSRKEGDRKLFSLALGALAVLGAYFAYTAKVADTAHLYLGLAILGLAGLPALQWAKRGDSGFPLMEAFMLTTANTYAVPLLT